MSFEAFFIRSQVIVKVRFKQLAKRGSLGMPQSVWNRGFSDGIGNNPAVSSFIQA
jgi:hypothetical protein